MMQTVSQRRFADVAPLQDHVAEMQWKGIFAMQYSHCCLRLSRWRPADRQVVADDVISKLFRQFSKFGPACCDRGAGAFPRLGGLVEPVRAGFAKMLNPLTGMQSCQFWDCFVFRSRAEGLLAWILLECAGKQQLPLRRGKDARLRKKLSDRDGNRGPKDLRHDPPRRDGGFMAYGAEHSAFVPLPSEAHPISNECAKQPRIHSAAGMNPENPGDGRASPGSSTPGPAIEIFGKDCKKREAGK